MDPFLTYLIKVSLIYLLCFVLYWLLFRKETFFRRNRVFLIMSLVLPALIPLIQFPIRSSLGGLVSEQGMSWIMVVGRAIAEPAGVSAPSMPVENISSSGNMSLGSMILIIYLVGVLFFLLRMIFSYSRVINLIASSKQKPLYKMILVITGKMVSPFSIFKWLVIPDKKTDHPDLDKIVSHEMVHYKQKHSYDLILSELVIAFQWFNPFAWMLKSSVVRNNEFLVDQTLINGVVDQREYQYALLNNSIGQQNLAMVNSFSKGLIKKRIKMMNKRKTRLVNRIKEILLLPFALVIILAFSAYTNKASDNLQDQDRKILKKEQKAEVKTQERKVVNQNNWTFTKNEGRIIVDGDKWTVTEYQDQDKKKKKKEGRDEKEHITIYVDGKMVTIKEYTGLKGEDGKVKILKLDDIDRLKEDLGDNVTKEKIIKLISEYETDSENTILVVRESEDGGEEMDIYVGSLSIEESEGDSKSIILLEKDKGIIKIRSGDEKGKVLYVTEDEGDNTKIHIRGEDGLKEFLIEIDGKIVDEEALNNLDSKKIESITILKKEEAVKEYGDKAKNGVIKIKTK